MQTTLRDVYIFIYHLRDMPALQGFKQINNKKEEAKNYGFSKRSKCLQNTVFAYKQGKSVVQNHVIYLFDILK